MKKLLLTSAVIFLLACAPALGATYYVDAVNGDNLNNGTATETPWKTISYSATNSASGDIINVLPGLYNSANGEKFPINMGGTKEVVGTDPNSCTVECSAANDVF
ncbi:MAG: DUF1565 domain-containing protein, partial [Candidatus Margulisiibacteriota bacterium]